MSGMISQGISPLGPGTNVCAEVIKGILVFLRDRLSNTLITGPEMNFEMSWVVSLGHGGVPSAFRTFTACWLGPWHAVFFLFQVKAK